MVLLEEQGRKKCESGARLQQYHMPRLRPRVIMSCRVPPITVISKHGKVV